MEAVCKTTTASGDGCAHQAILILHIYQKTDLDIRRIGCGFVAIDYCFFILPQAFFAFAAFWPQGFLKPDFSSLFSLLERCAPVFI
ncbi:MAG: hypothetical protein CSA53_03560 [Gammaproteobacteria bacterium]|nr:MAG: hypothetical protein CSA53_03560 [Gammaproteobacteria bacterium]